MCAMNDNRKGESPLSDLIRREIGRPINQRHLVRLPAFAPDRVLPDRFAALLGELDRAEREAGDEAS